MSSLYEINGEYLKLMAELEESEGELTPELEEKLVISEKDFKDKALNYIKIIKKWEGDNSAIKTEIERLKKLEKSNKASIDRLKKNLENSMNLRESRSEDLGLFKLGFRKSTVVLVDEENLPKKWYKQKITEAPDKVELKKALAQGEEIPGAELKEKQNLVIK